MSGGQGGGIDPYMENFEDFFEQALNGYVIANGEGVIVRVNRKLCEWLGVKDCDLQGKRFSDLLSVGGKIYYETHLWPLLRMQGYFDEVVLELFPVTGTKLRVLINGYERRGEDGNTRFIRYTILKASDRLRFEQNLKLAKTEAEKELLKQKAIVSLREQLIAVLGHDLRNPLSAISSAANLLETSVTDPAKAGLVIVMKRSTARMVELINNVMDFARTRLGEGIILAKKNTLLEPVLNQVIEELRLIYPARKIVASYKLHQEICCDPSRIAQLFSNLIANAITHGSMSEPVIVRASDDSSAFTLAVCNEGPPIPAHLHEQLFEPFSREANAPQQQGLGLGLYICSEIAKAHRGSIDFTSTAKETCFTFVMPVTPDT